MIPFIHINSIEVLTCLCTVFNQLIFRIIFADGPVCESAILNKLLDELYSQSLLKLPVAAKLEIAENTGWQ